MKANIIIVEDESIVAMDIEQSVKSFGHDVVAIVDNGPDAILKAEETRPDLILMDIKLKGKMDGIEAAKEILKRFNIPVIFLTAYADESTIERATLSEPMAFLLKPIKKNELKTTIRIVLHKYANILTQQHDAAERLGKSEENFKLFVDSVTDYALYMMDKSGRIISWNAGAERIEGYKADEIIGKNFNIFYSVEDREAKKPEQELEIAASTGKYEEEKWRIKKDGSKFWASVVITALLDDQGLLRGYGEITRNLTAIKTLEEELRQAIKDRDEMIGVISHELKNPLTNMQLSTTLLLKILPKNPELEKARSIIGKINPSIERMNRLISDLLDVTRIEAKSLKVDMGIVALDKITIDIADFFMPSLHEKNIQLKTNIPSDCREVLCDEDRTIQILSNLINNAIKFTDSGGHIFVNAKKIGNMVEISVEDTGKGISEKNLTHIFNRFWQEKNSAHIGTGLGLAISKGLVEAQGGKMWVASQYEAGTTFYFTLRLAEKENKLFYPIKDQIKEKVNNFDENLH
jgi:PAS domain S-box-containing protein